MIMMKRNQNSEKMTQTQEKIKNLPNQPINQRAATVNNNQRENNKQNKKHNNLQKEATMMTMKMNQNSMKVGLSREAKIKKIKN